VEKEGFFFVIVCQDSSQPLRVRGNAFSIAPGRLLTCKHVVNGVTGLVALDVNGSAFHKIKAVRFSSDEKLDLALVEIESSPRCIRYIPMLPFANLRIGEKVFVYGFLDVFGESYRETFFEEMYFSGSIVSLFAVRQKEKGPYRKIMLPFPILEGLSGSPVLTYHNGVKVCGISIGSIQSRILAHQVEEFVDDRSHWRETVNRVVEYGLSYHPAVIECFLRELIPDKFCLTAERVEVDGLF
jgi:S1-C subfamily serine protease